MEVTHSKPNIEDFQSICRVCLLPDNLKPFEELNVYAVFQKLKPMLDIEEILEEQLPKSICENCTKELENISTFLTKYKECDGILKSVINERRNNNQEMNSQSSNNECSTSIIQNIFPRNENSENAKDVPENICIRIEIVSEDNSSGETEELEINLEDLGIDIKGDPIINKKFTCDYCNKQFERICHLQEHINMHLGLKPFKCNTCGKCFAKRQTLKTHYYVHTGNRPFKCKLCGKSFLRETHLSKHSLNINNCIENINKEVKESHQPIPEVTQGEKNITKCTRIFKCKFCDRKFTRSNTWKNHVSSHIRKKPFKCTICNWTGISGKNLKIHIKNSHGQNLTPKVNKDGEIKKLKIAKRDFLCNTCGKGFTRKSSLNSHLKIHTGEKNFECDICGLKFTLKCTLNRHLAVHKNKKTYICEVCGQPLSHKRYLLKHMEIFHSEKSELTNKKKIITCYCSICGQGFCSDGWLKRHEKVHKTKINKIDLNPDNKSPMETRRFLCTDCGKQFTHKCNLDRHIFITHSGKKPFECKICGDKFTAKMSLECHLNIHKGTKPYRCKQCPKTFRQPSSLRKHILVHTGERRYDCYVCAMSFKTNSNLRAHLKRHA